MIKQIEVRSKSKAREFTSDVLWAAISISTYPNDWPKLNGAKRMGLLQLAFEDTEFREAKDEYVLFTPEDAARIYEFVKEMEAKEVELILVHCEAGLSRSPAIACVLNQAFLKGEAKIYFEIYYPNKLVYEVMIQEGIRLGHLEYNDIF